MPKSVEVKVHKVADDGLPDVEKLGPGRVAFLFDGFVMSGRPLGADKDQEPEDVRWEADLGVGDVGPFLGVTHWVEFPNSIATIERT